MNILITGGAGMIGQAIAKRHIDNGDSVYIYDAKLNDYIDYSHIKYGTLISKEEMIFMFHGKVFDVVSHQAALVSVGHSNILPEHFSMHNIQFTAFLIQLMIDTKFDGHVIFAGSMGAYGESNYYCRECKSEVDIIRGTYIISEKNRYVPVRCAICGSEDITSNTMNEMQSFKPISIYGATKASQEQLLKVFSELYNVKVTSLRYFSVYSTETSPLNPYTGVLSIIANKFLNAENIALNEDGFQTRDFINVEDIAEANFIAATRYEWTGFNAINIGTGYGITLSECCDLFITELNKRFGTNKTFSFNKAYRKGDIYHSTASVFRMLDDLKFAPKHNIVNDIIKYAAYISENRDKFKIGFDNCELADDVLDDFNLFVGKGDKN